MGNIWNTYEKPIKYLWETYEIPMCLLHTKNLWKAMKTLQKHCISQGFWEIPHAKRLRFARLFSEFTCETPAFRKVFRRFHMRNTCVSQGFLAISHAKRLRLAMFFWRFSVCWNSYSSQKSENPRKYHWSKGTKSQKTRNPRKRIIADPRNREEGLFLFRGWVPLAGPRTDDVGVPHSPLFFWKWGIFTFWQMIPRREITDGFEQLFRSKRTFCTFSEKVHFSTPKWPKCSSPYVFPGQINDLGREKCTFSKKVHFLHFYHFGRQKASAW